MEDPRKERKVPKKEYEGDILGQLIAWMIMSVAGVFLIFIILTGMARK